MKILFLTLIFLLGFYLSNAQKDIDNWVSLMKLEFIAETNPVLGITYEKPIFCKALKKLNGKELVFSGFIWKSKSGKTILSKFSKKGTHCTMTGRDPFSPDSIIELSGLLNQKYEEDKAYLIKGILRIDETASERLYFKIENVLLEKYK